MLPALLGLVGPLLRRRDTWYVLVILALAGCLYAARHQIKDLSATLAARPKVEIHTEQKVQTVRVAGPVRVETKTVYVPGTKEIQYVDRIVDRAPVTTTVQKETELDKKVTPACPASAAPKWRYAGVMVDPLSSSKLVGLEGGLTFWDRLNLGVNARFDHGLLGAATIGVRF